MLRVSGDLLSWENFCGAEGGKSGISLFGVSERSTRVDNDVFATLKLCYLGCRQPRWSTLEVW